MQAIVVVCALLAASPGTNWPAFRGDGTSCTSATDLPLHWSADENIGWRATLAGRGQSSPVVWGQQVFVTSVAGDNKERLFVEAFDLGSGRQLWKQEFAGTQKIPDSDYVSRGAPTPAVDGRRLYAFFESGNLLALDHDGQLVWQRSLVDEYGPFEGNHGLGSSLALADDTVVVLVDHSAAGYLLAVDPATGKNRWKIDRPARVSWSSPIVARRNAAAEVLISSAGVAQAYRLSDGELLWQFDKLEGNTVPSPTADSRVVVIGATDAGSNLALSRDGAGALGPDAVVWKNDQVTSSFASPLIYQGHVYLVNRAGGAFCLDLATGEQRWTLRLPGSVWASPIGAQDRVYFFTRDGATRVVAAGADLKELAENELPNEDRVYGVAAVDGTFIVRTENQLTRIGKPAD